MQITDIREEARRLIERLPPHSTWNDLVRAILVRQAIESGLSESHAGKTTSNEEVRKRFGFAS